MSTIALLNAMPPGARSLAGLGSMPGADLDAVLSGLDNSELLAALDELNTLGDGAAAFRDAGTAGGLGAIGCSCATKPANAATNPWAAAVRRVRSRVRDHVVGRSLPGRSPNVAAMSTGGIRYATLKPGTRDVYTSTPRDPNHLRYSYSVGSNPRTGRVNSWRGMGNLDPAGLVARADELEAQYSGLAGYGDDAPSGAGEHVVSIEGYGEPAAVLDGLGRLYNADAAAFVLDPDGNVLARTRDALGRERLRLGRLDRGLGSWLSDAFKKGKGPLAPFAAIAKIAAPIASVVGGPVAPFAMGFQAFTQGMWGGQQQGGQPMTQQQRQQFWGTPGFNGAGGDWARGLPNLSIPLPGGGQMVFNNGQISVNGQQVGPQLWPTGGGGGGGKAPAKLGPPSPVFTSAPRNGAFITAPKLKGWGGSAGGKAPTVVPQPKGPAKAAAPKGPPKKVPVEDAKGSSLAAVLTSPAVLALGAIALVMFRRK